MQLSFSLEIVQFLKNRSSLEIPAIPPTYLSIKKGSQPSKRDSFGHWSIVLERRSGAEYSGHLQ